MLAVQDKVQVFAEILAFLIVQVTCDLKDRPRSPAGLEHRIFLRNSRQQCPDHLCAVDEFLMECLEFHISSFVVLIKNR
ncbi:MAG: hypothetical protein MZV64_62665 [Ignavibacteriales bacterium]|nr:hypothetical protein [Ignavibacteriales bacterium]